MLILFRLVMLAAAACVVICLLGYIIQGDRVWLRRAGRALAAVVVGGLLFFILMMMENLLR